MRKHRKDAREFKQLSEQLRSIRQIAGHTKVGNLWSHEAAVRKKIKALQQIDERSLPKFYQVYEGYLELLDEISRRLLDDYNERHQTNFRFEELVKTYQKEYLSSGIITALVSSHIPTIMVEAFTRCFPTNPKDEYPKARAIKRKVYLHLGQTNTGKTYQALERLKQSQTGIYLAPLRILALEVYERLVDAEIACDLKTGEEEILTPHATHQSSTVEKLDLDQVYDVAIIDEIQLLGDSQRGAAWTRALLGLRCAEIHICGAANVKKLLIEILNDCEDEIEIHEYIRQVPLVIEKEPYLVKRATQGDAFIFFSKRRVLDLAKFFSLQGITASVIYGDLPPEVRKLQYHDFIEGKNSVLVSTDAIGMGVNLPIRRIIFMNLCKFDGDEERWLTSQEVKQIAGRAGRKGLYEVGYVATQGRGYSFLKNQIENEDEPIDEAVIGPSEAILNIEGLPLKEKLALWSNMPVEVQWYRKMDVRDYIIILDKIRRYRLDEEIEWKIMRLPFDVHQEALLSTLLILIEEYFVRQEEVPTRPAQGEKRLTNLEIYYQKVNLYYSFCKAFKIDFELKWVYSERIRISEMIQELLVNVKY